jgi:triosephosphate isomerase
MDNFLIIANWKCNPQTLKEAERLFGAAGENVANVKNLEVVVCAPFVYVQNLKSNIQNLSVGAQNCFWEQKGPHTGEISPSMLKDVGCEYVILGHSERRKDFGETDEIINKKIKAALAARLKPILCIGEKTEERERIKEVVTAQLRNCFAGVEQNQIKNIIIVYEPVWAISTTADSKDCSPEEAFSAGLMIKKIMIDLYGKSIVQKIKIIYGGSVDSKDAVAYIKEAKMDGVLVGAASLNANEFGKIISSVAELNK